MRTKIRSKTWTISNAIPASRKITILISNPKNKKTSSSLNDLYVNNWQENGEKIRIDTLYSVFYNLYRLDKDPIRLKKQS